MSDSPNAALPQTTPSQLQADLEAKTAYVIDLRMSSKGDQIPTSRQYDPKQLTAADPLVLPIPHDGITVLVDEKGDGKHLQSVAEALAKSKYLDVRVLEGGFHAWTEAGLPVEEVSMKQPVAGAAEHQLFR